jgi:TP901-1 family phage major tail protein
MPKIPGYRAALYVGDPRVKVAGGRDITLTIESEELDAASFDSEGWAETVAGLKSWGLDNELLYVSEDASQDSLYQALVDGESVVVALELGDVTHAGTAVVQGWELGQPQDDAVTISVSLAGTGPLTRISSTNEIYFLMPFQII